MRKLSVLTGISLAAFLMVSSAFAKKNDLPDLSGLHGARKHTIQLYLDGLATRNAPQVVSQFVPGAVVHSTSRGEVSASQLFPSFLGSLISSSVEVQNVYKSTNDKNLYGVSFSFHWTESDGSKGGGSYTDEFVFQKHSDKLETVIMYENLK